MGKQKFNKGSLVRVAKNLGSSMSHFQSDCDAIIIGSYADQFGGEDVKSYTIYIKGSGETSWYNEHQLELIEENRSDLLENWKKEKKKENDLHSNLDWIFENGQQVLKSADGATVSSLAKCLGVDNLWGSNGEGFVYYQNAMNILSIAKPYLEKNDKNGWLKFVEEKFKKNITLTV